MNEKARWICHPRDGDENRLVPVFRKPFSVKHGLKEAKLSLSAHGLYEVQLNGQAVTDHKFTPGLTSYYYRIQVQTYDVGRMLKEGCNEILVTIGEGWWRGSHGWSMYRYCHGTNNEVS